MNTSLTPENTTYLCHQDTIPVATAKGFDLGDTAIFVVNQMGQFYAYRDRCPHRGVRLEWLPDRFLNGDNELIMCATHGALFVIESGLCVSGPCHGQTLEPITISLQNDCLYIQSNVE